MKHVKSNAITIAKDGRLLGMGSGQPNRVNSVRIAIEKSASEVQVQTAVSEGVNWLHLIKPVEFFLTPPPYMHPPHISTTHIPHAYTVPRNGPPPRLFT